MFIFLISQFLDGRARKAVSYTHLDVYKRQVLYYTRIDESKMCERFLRFTDVSNDRSSDGLFSHVQHEINDFRIADKLIGQTYDGGSVMNGHVSGLI